MAHIDARSGEVIIRIVYDGASSSGKTTNVDRLCTLVSRQRSGLSRKSPGSTSETTAFFDWLEFAGGVVDGRRVRCQVLSVAGRPEHEQRRLRILETADAIVFVADSRRESLEETRGALSQSTRFVAKEGHAPVGFILQANKQGEPGAQAPADLRAALELPDSTPTVGSAAARGDGVMETFVLAMRLATDRVRALLLEDRVTPLAASNESPEALHASLFEVAPAPTAPWIARRNAIASADRATLPQAQNVMAGHVWPPVKGRTTLNAATRGSVVVHEHVLPWAPEGAIELIADTGFVFHSTQRWVHGGEGEARLNLLTHARQLLTLGPLLPESRALALTQEPEGWRLWLVTPHFVSLAEAAVAAVRSNSVASVSAFIAQAGGARKRLGGHGFAGTPFPAGAGGIALHEGQVYAMSLVDGAASPGLEAKEPFADLANLLARLSRENPELAHWFDAEGRSLLLREQGREGSAR